MAKQDYEACDADFNRRADMISDALEGLDEETAQELLALFAGRHLSRFEATLRKRVRRDLHRAVDRETREWVIAGCDA